MKYERLTERRGTPLTMSMWGGSIKDLRVYNRLIELENKIEQGTLIELPCKVGDTIWVVDESWGHREDGTWGSISEMHEGKAYSFTYYGNCIHIEDDFTSNYYLWEEDAFLTREEAEKRLRGLQGAQE